MARYNRTLIVRDYQAKWNAMSVTKPDEVYAAAKRIVANAEAYKEVEKETGVPWYFVGVLHMRECDNNMKGCLANGELIVGTKRKTRLVPRGRGPYATFLESAVDALNLQGFAAVTDWSPAVCCYEGEAFNGFGYRAMGKPSPYVLGATQFYSHGKYVRDGVYSDKAVDPQLGIMPVMKRAIELAGGEVQPAAPLPKITPADIVQASRKATWLTRFGHACKVTFGGLTLGTLSEKAGIAKETMDNVAQFFQEHAIIILITAAILGYFVVKYVLSLMTEDANAGRYTPSGKAA